MREFYIYNRGQFWNGYSWTTVLEFAKKYSLAEALDIRLKRFHRNAPPVAIRLCTSFRKPNCDASLTFREDKKR